MADTTTVCSMCGDVGFPDKLFRCMRCHSRFQHSYCSSYYEDDPSKRADTCDWCLSEDRSRRAMSHSRRQPPARDSGREDGGSRGKTSGSSSSSKATGRRYKLLKDVMC